ncbi:MAG: hypothetical protein QM784_37500 [Polyangiaceae bacterium]
MTLPLTLIALRVFAPLDVNDEAMESSGWCVLERPFELEFDESNLYFDCYVLLGFRVDKCRAFPAPSSKRNSRTNSRSSSGERAAPVWVAPERRTSR